MGIYFFEVNLRNLKTNPYKIYSCTNTYPILSRVLTSLIRLTPPLLRREREKKKSYHLLILVIYFGTKFSYKINCKLKLQPYSIK